jgi:hypothetical protein
LGALVFAAFLGAAFAAGSAGGAVSAAAVVGFGVTVEQRAWNSAFALFS